jgi:hypothetical protein
MVVPILAGFSLYFKNQVNGFFGTTYASNYLLIGLIIVEALNGFFAYLVEKKKRNEDKMERHRQDIMKQLEAFVTYSRIIYNEISLDQDDLDYAKLPIHDKYIKHLQAYEDVWQSYSDAKKSVGEINGKIKNNIKECFRIAHEKLDSFHDLPDSDRFIGPEKPYFSSKKFSEDLLSNIEYLYNLETPMPILEIRPFGNSDYSYITNQHLEVATGEREKLEKLLPILKQLQNDTKLHSLVKEIIELRKSLENNIALKKFNNLRTQLFSDLSLGQKNLRGRCDYCP